MQLFGRRQILTDESNITANNVVRELEKAFVVHSQNCTEADYLYNYYRGRTPILQKTKESRPDINHKVCENRANEIVNFKVGYCFCEDIQYVRRGNDDSLMEDIKRFNDLMHASGKSASDKELAEWMHICGTGYRIVLPSDSGDIEFYTLDPRGTFVVYHNDLGKKPVMGVTYVIDENGVHTFSVYTKDSYFKVRDGAVVESVDHILRDVPIVEYPMDNARLGAFETVLPLLDAINQVESNRIDDVEQFVNSILTILGGQLTEEVVAQINDWCMMCLPDGVDAKYLSASLKQSDTQILVDSLYQNVLTICGMPNRNGGSSTSDTGQAVLLRDGWESAEARAKAVETMFEDSERRFLRIAFRILAGTESGIRLSVENVDVKFPRRYSANLNTKAQALKLLLDSGVAPVVAFASVNIWNDPLDAYLQSQPYLKKWDIDPAEEVYDASTIQGFR